MAVAMLAGCASSHPHTFGQFNDLAPRVAATRGERLPQHVTVELGRPANIAVFLVVPGRGSTLLFPEDSAQSGYMEGGSHLVETSIGKNGLGDSSRLIRRPAGGATPGQRPGTYGRQGGVSRNGFPDNSSITPNEHGFLLIYASQEPLSYSTLAAKVSGLSIPAYDDDALNTVTKLIRETTHTSGPWAAYATDFPP